MNKNEVVGMVAVALIVIALIGSIFWIMHTLILLIPCLIAGAVAGAFVYWFEKF